MQRRAITDVQRHPAFPMLGVSVPIVSRGRESSQRGACTTKTPSSPIASRGAKAGRLGATMNARMKVISATPDATICRTMAFLRLDPTLSRVHPAVNTSFWTLQCYTDLHSHHHL